MKNKIILSFFTIFIIGFALASNWVTPPSSNPGLVELFNFNDNSTNGVLGNFNWDYNSNGTAVAEGKYGAGFNVTTSGAVTSPNMFLNVSKHVNITYEMWFKPDRNLVTVTSQQFIMVSGNTSRYFNFYVTNLQTCGEIYSTEGSNVDSLICTGTQSLLGGVWYHLAYSINDTSASFYINGTLIGTDIAFTETTYPSGNLHTTMGVTPGGAIPANPINWTVDSILFWNVTRNITEILSDMNADIFHPVTLVNPLNNTEVISGSGLNFSSKQTSTGTLSLNNATLEIWNLNGEKVISNFTSMISGQSNSSNWTIELGFGDYVWNVLSCSNNSATTSCDIAESNSTLRVSPIKNGSLTYNTPVNEISSQTFLINATYNNVQINSISATLIYNTTRNPAIPIYTQGNNITFSETLIIPNVNSQQTIPLYWEFQLSNSSGNSFYYNTSIVNQIVQIITIDDCSTGTVLMLNYTLRDEETQNFLTVPDQNTTVDVNLILKSQSNSAINTSFSKSYPKTNPVQVCFATNLTNEKYLLDVQTRYNENTSYVVEYHNIQNFTVTSTSIPQLINLLDLKTIDSQEFLITFKDENFLPVPDALINIQRKYVSEGNSKTVEIPKTDDDGQAIGHLVLSDVIYTISVSKFGKLLGTYPNIVAFCNNQATGDCKINLQEISSDQSTPQLEGGEDINYSLTFNPTTRVASSTFTILSGASSIVQINVTAFDNIGNNTLCSSSLSASGGTVSCTVPSSYGNGSIIVSLYKDGNWLTNKIFSIKQSAKNTFGGTRILFAALLFMTLPLMAVGSGFIVIIAGMIGLVLAALFNFIEGGSFFGINATLLWIFLAGGLLLWKIAKR